ncbi:PilN domain-containing protein [Marinibactrum halimedae]|uniref:Pilus assembly protein PilN n=1 Tax=Marinibactrum halimedae TaxID=1444977 RepID=A0AA37WKI6_9GAMM|nr:PilN domain-containing protein [Marinibactrum halimedae]MCD9459744.1 PilN domain-containing protein [Marinibactrum halimedae]GLS24499.1 pilus assembly protein PilN [Marinibactrum halimedae]
MANINLLPWRDELRAEKQKEFYTVLALVGAAAAVVVFMWLGAVNGQIDSQRGRNALLNKEIAQLDKQVEEIKDIKKRREELLERMRIIQGLQGDRPQIVRVFDDLVRAIPDGVYFDQLNRDGSKISISGVAESNNRVSSLMRRLDDSDWFEKPNLLSVTKERPGDDGDNVPNKFNMTVQITAPKKDDEEEGV